MAEKEKHNLYNQHGFPTQSQKEPGIQSQMSPIPDDGATNICWA